MQAFTRLLVSMFVCFFTCTSIRLSVHSFAGGVVCVCTRLKSMMKWRADRSGSPLLDQEESTAGEGEEGSGPGLTKEE